MMRWRTLVALILLALSIPTWLVAQPATLRLRQLIITDGQGAVLQMPRLTTAQRDASSHQNGELIYCTDCAPAGSYVYQAGAWTSFLLGSVGPQAIGGALAGNNQLLLTGSFDGSATAGPQSALNITSTIQGRSDANLFGLRLAPILVEAASGTHSIITAALITAGTITAGAALTTDTVSLLVQGAVAAAGTTNSSTVKIDSVSSGATNNYALWIASGNFRFAGVMGSDVGIASGLGPAVNMANPANLAFTGGTTDTRWSNQGNSAVLMILTNGGILGLGSTTPVNSGLDLRGNQQNVNFSLAGTTASDLSVLYWRNSTPTATANIWATGDASGSGSILRLKGLGHIDLVPNNVGIDSTAAAFRVGQNSGIGVGTSTLTNMAAGQMAFGTTTFAALPAAPNGTLLYCSDCDPPTLVVNTCTSAGAATGAFAVRVNGAWNCIG